jgi:hypothetical protein
LPRKAVYRIFQAEVDGKKPLITLMDIFTEHLHVHAILLAVLTRKIKPKGVLL